MKRLLATIVFPFLLLGACRSGDDHRHQNNPREKEAAQVEERTLLTKNAPRATSIRAHSPAGKKNPAVLSSGSPEEKEAAPTPHPSPAADDSEKAPAAPPKVAPEAPSDTGAATSSKAEKEKQATVKADAVSHQTWDALLRQYVNPAGKVDYAGLKKSKAQLDRYLRLLSEHPVQAEWSRQEKMAYWINAYNAFTIKLIIDNYPLSSIRDLHGGNPWDVEWIELGDETYTLNNIEHDILRPWFKDPRIHFAVNCAAASCPPLLNRAFTPQQLDRQLDERADTFINNPAYNKLDPQKIQLSKIFEWYRQDFGSLIEYVDQYASVDIQPDAKIEFLEYDWSLNEQ